MSRVFAFALGSLGIGSVLITAVVIGCSDPSVEDGTERLDGSTRKDSAPVDPFEGGASLDGGPSPLPTCAKYCSLVMANCTGGEAQYASSEDCLDFCEHLPPTQPASDAEEKKAASVACRQYWADSPARTNPKANCLAAGPFGGNVCGDRCRAFCTVVLDACDSDGGVPVYATQPDCASDCATFKFRESGMDGGGEGPTGPKTGDTLNCRLYHLRAVTKSAQSCSLLRAGDAGPCH